MKKIGELVQEADWKMEKHIPVIECVDAVMADEIFEVKVTIGKEVAHPNTTEHHISWMSLFNAHGASVQGPNTSSVYTHHAAATWMKTAKSGTLIAVSMCNIHGLWQSSKEIKLK